MVQYIQGWFAPAAPGQAAQGPSIVVDTVVAVALSALSFLLASSVERESPALATLFRLVPIGISFIWLFRRYNLVDGMGGGAYQAPGAAVYVPPPQPAVVIQVPPPQPRHWWQTNILPVPIPFAAPQPVYQAPVYRSPYQPPAPMPHVHVQQPYHAPQQAQTVYTVNQGGVDPRSHARGHQQQQGGGFPHVQRAPAQTHGGGFPNVQRGTATEPAQAANVAQNLANNQRQMFAAAANR